jgi:hypothetical protein
MMVRECSNLWGATQCSTAQCSTAWHIGKL